MPNSGNTRPDAKVTRKRSKAESRKPRQRDIFPVVGVGASAGGLEALSELLRTMPENPGIALVLVSHLDPVHESILPELLQRETRMAVLTVHHGMRVQRDKVYVMPHNVSLTIDGSLRVGARPKNSIPTVIDDFMTSLSIDRGGSAVGVILSGAGSDGARGLTAIKEHGGTTFVQDDTAAYPGMPRAAESMGCVDFVLSPADIAEHLLRLTSDPFFGRLELDGDNAEDDIGWRNVLLLLLRTSGVDFSLYKKSSVRRRVARRMTLQRMKTLVEYEAYARQDSKEIAALVSDILIHVTGFFREPLAFRALRRKVLAPLAPQDRETPIRIWSVGCSSGEETYSIAIALLEELESSGRRATVQIFGTDISEHLIDRARAGVYSRASLSPLSVKRRRRYFTRVAGGYQISRSVRDLCVFARHDLATDPPFSNMDLVSCRNLLIYFEKPLQRRAVSMFHYALNTSGRLWLGKSESLESHADLFAAVDSRYKIYANKRRPGQNVSVGRAEQNLAVGMRPQKPMQFPRLDIGKEVERLVINKFAPPGFVVDAELMIRRFVGDTSGLVRPQSGEASFHLLKMLRPELVVPLRAALQAARKGERHVQRRGVQVAGENGVAPLDIEIQTITGRVDGETVYLVLCRTHADSNLATAEKPDLDAGGTDEYEWLRNELNSAREQLRSLIEDQEGITEELRAANEEIVSSNEELQSTNEELETAKEELQSSNEELTSLNEELRTRNVELTTLADDLSNLLVGVEIPIVILGSDLTIRRFTPSARQVLNLIPGDVGRPIDQLRSSLDIDWRALVRKVVSTSQEHQVEVQDAAHRWFSLRLHPYRSSARQRVDGVLAAIVDVDTQKRIGETIVETTSQPLVVLDHESRVVSANPAFYRSFQIAPRRMNGQPFFTAARQAWGNPRLERLVKRIFNGEQVEREPLQHRLRKGPERELLVSGKRMSSEDRTKRMILLAVDDVSEQRKAEQKLRDSEARFRLLAEGSLDLIGLIDEKGRYHYVSPSCAALLGCEPEELLGRTLSGRIHPADRAAFREAALKVPLASARPSKHAARVRVDDGSYRWFEFKVQRAQDEERTGVRLLTSGRDITEHVEVRAELTRNKEDLSELATALMKSQDAEQSRLGRELHDDFSQRLGILIQHIERARSSRDPERSATLLAEAVTLGRGITESMRSLSHRMHPTTLDHFPLDDALRALAEEFSRASGIRVRFSVRGTTFEPRRDVKLCAYRVLQEALRNVQDHADVNRVSVTLTFRPESLRLSVNDRGQGFDVDGRHNRGLGFVSMEERVKVLGGELKVVSEPGSGTRVSATYPYIAPP